MNKPEKQPVPSLAEQKKIKLALNLRVDDPLPRCRGRSAHKVKKFEKAGNNDHSGAGHLCDECMCHHVAGYGTTHYGTGYCIHHENSIHYKGHAEEYAHKQSVALQQGYSNVYKYESSSRYIEATRRASEEAKGRADLSDEIAVLRSTLQTIINAIDKQIDRQIVDEKNIKLLDKLANTISKLAKTNLEITDTDYVHVDQVKQWAYGLVRVVQDVVSDPKLQQELIEGFSAVVQPQAGRQK